jgi:UPF0271 protein
MPLSHIKPHGSLYSMAARQPPIAHAICDAAEFQVPLLGMTGTLHETVYRERGHHFVAEFYADLEYAEDGSLIVTREHPPVHAADAVIRCMRAIREGFVASVRGGDVAVGSDTICVHSDTPGIVECARMLRAALDAASRPEPAGADQRS